MNTENSKADFIMTELNAFLRESEELLNVLNYNTLEKHHSITFISEAFQKILPCVGTSTAVFMTGAHNVALADVQGACLAEAGSFVGLQSTECNMLTKPRTSYFSPPSTQEIYKVFGYDIDIATIGNIAAVVGVIGSICSFLHFYEEYKKNERITDGRVSSEFVMKLERLRDILQDEISRSLKLTSTQISNPQ